MSITLSAFGAQLLRSPLLGLIVLLLLAVLLVNGWTDAPNAIAAAVSTGALSFRRAAGLAALCNLLGALVTARLCPTVAVTLRGLAGFEGGGSAALPALCAALSAIVLWALLAWRFGLPTSESHALIAGLTGAALALPGGAANLSAGAWARVLLGLMLSVGLGYTWGGGWARLLRRGRALPLRGGQIAGAAITALLHGAQDGQKFIGLFLLTAALALGSPPEAAPVPLWLAVLCAGVMALGTRVGGRRIIRTVGQDMVRLSPRAGLAADLGCGCTLLLCTLLGLPVSTTHAKTAALLGSGRRDGGPVSRPVVRSLAAAWALTFPCCALLGFLLTRLFLLLPRLPA